MDVIGDIVGNFWFFQTESVVPLFQEISVWIVILFAGLFVVATTVKVIMQKNEQAIPIGLLLFPVTIMVAYAVLLLYGDMFGFNFGSFSLSEMFTHALNYWWVFLIFWPVVLLKLPLQLIGKKGESDSNSLVSFVFAPFYEEIAFRYFAINTLFLLTNSVEIALFFSSIAFALIHLPNKDGDKWIGPISLNLTFLSGLVFGIIAIQYGLIFAILVHSVANVAG
ncbi:hypothetical protein CL620_04070, partial [archaeon]|nr:hypothetical protein [archaeon]